MAKTFVLKDADVQRKWLLVDAADQTLGRLAVKLANMLRGKTKPSYTPSVDSGDFVVVVNASKVRVTGRKEEDKLYRIYSGFRGGEYTMSVAEMRAKHPERIIERAVKGMLPRNKQAVDMMSRLKVYGGEQHPHAAQKPKPVDVK